ncbi:helix-turn-helix domain-containing protein [Flavobacterium sp. 3HN19-14]|uniref:helix-turn-helix domain-containing protein n=1 Tax=Flavobacterium sp. 3HN19-14 TaxID=3448133 RepID=UPI003EDEC6DC
MENLKSHNAISVIDRLKKLLKIKRDAQLADVLGVRANTISTWKKRDTLDYDAILSICELYELDLTWFFLIRKNRVNFQQRHRLSAVMFSFNML